MPEHPSCRVFGGSTESAQGGLGRPLGKEAVGLAELVPGSPGVSSVGSGLCCQHAPDLSELSMGWAHGPFHTHLKESHGDSVRFGAACRGWGG